METKQPKLRASEKHLPDCKMKREGRCDCHVQFVNDHHDRCIFHRHPTMCDCGGVRK